MTKIGQAFVADDYVVRYGMRGFLAALLGLAVWTVLAVIVVAARAIFPSVPAAVALAMGELGLLAACGRRTAPGRQAGGPLRGAQRRGVFRLRPGEGRCPWDRICAVELFTEPGPGRRRRRRGAYRCVGVQINGTAASSGRSGDGRSGDGRTRADGMRTGRINPNGTSGDGQSGSHTAG